MRAEKLPVQLNERPVMGWGSDAVADLVGELDLPYISLVPGASYRGLHDSLVNYLGNAKPEMVLCLHEEHAVAVAHGYAKVTGRPMAVALHSNVGLMHATMAIFNAFCARAPMLLLGATGPVDAAQRRPWIDWVHTSIDQGALIRNYCKWDDQPASVEAALESVMRAFLATQTYPSAPTYVCLDSAMQEAPLREPVKLRMLGRYRVPSPPAPDSEQTKRISMALTKARRPLLLVGRGGRGEREWASRVELAERLGACALTDMKTPASFPTDHRLHPAVTGTRLTRSGRDLVRRSDMILSLDWVDLAGTLAKVFEDQAMPQVISCTSDFVLHNGWSGDQCSLIAADISVTADPDLLVKALLDTMEGNRAIVRDDWPGELNPSVPDLCPARPDEVLMPELAQGLREVLGRRSVSYVALPHGWRGTDVHTRGPLDYLGRDGGGGVGSGPGLAVGAALALQGSGRLPVAVLGDGDYLMGCSALWTAAHHRIPLLVVIANNRSYFNDEVHQESMAKMRGRPIENRAVSLHLRDPDPDLAGLARSLGLKGYGPVLGGTELKAVLETALADVEGGEAVVVDILVNPRGYLGLGTTASASVDSRLRE